MTSPLEIKSDLVANRGDSAVRIIETCRRLGIKTVAIFTEPDRNSVHVKLADEAYLVSSYMNAGEIVALALKTGCQALHPGYGFLAEKAELARMCEEQGICFVGPSADVIKQMGNKVNARRMAGVAGIPILKGTEVANPVQMLQEVERLGMKFPVMLKATAGGGGLVIEIVHAKEDLLAVVERLQIQAERRFGDPAIYAEEYLEGAAHIEVQVAVDQYGNAIHLGERECSLQRGHQKLEEESPSSKLKRVQRRQICVLARRFAQTVGYTGIGTIEFLFDPASGKFYFLEMNTRIQVEHAVTEMLTDIDLVELQFMIAAGKRIHRKKARGGHALEVRIYPEGLNKGKFFPHPGAFALLDFPHDGWPWVRLDTVLEPFSPDTPQLALEYQNLLGRLIVWGATREEAIQRMNAVLSKIVITAGTNIPFLQALMGLEAFLAGTHHVQTLEDPRVLSELEKTAKKFAVQELGRVLLYQALLL